MKKVNCLALPHLMAEELGTGNIVQLIRANPRLLEGQVEISPRHPSVTQVVSQVDMIYSLGAQSCFSWPFWGGSEVEKISLEQLPPLLLLAPRELSFHLDAHT